MKKTLSVLLALFVGCAPYEPPAQTSSFAQPQTEYIVMIVMDLSGSFAHLMADDGKAYDFALAVYNEYFSKRIGCPDELIIAQFSGTHRSLLWRGSPLELRQQFPSAAAFKTFLMSKADPNGSVIHDGLAHALEYMTDDPVIAAGNAKHAVFVLSDMLDNGPDPERSAQRLATALNRYAQRNGVVGMWYVDQDLMTTWRENLRNAGFKDFRVECEIDVRPNLPVF